MKKSILLLLFLIGIIQSCLSQYFLIDTAKLNTAYRELKNNPNTPECQKKFFDAFPNNWMEFITTYQYVDKKGYDLRMYSIAEEQIRALGSRVTLIPDSIYCKKLVNIAIGGVWGADAPNYFQMLLHKIMWEKMEGMLEVISHLRKGNQFQFWLFYWSNIVKSKSLEVEYKRLLKLNLDIFPKEMEIMAMAFKYFYNGIALPEYSFIDRDYFIEYGQEESQVKKIKKTEFTI